MTSCSTSRPAGGATGVTQYFHSTVPYVEPTYAFSGNFGGELEGRGVGLSIANSITQFYQGRLELTGVPGHCTDATAILKRDAFV